MLSNQIRPCSSELLELHVFYVPEEVWNFKLNTVPVDIISKFFSAGFIRVSPHMTLKTLRKNLSEYLGEDAVVDKYVFLKCIGEKLAVVKAKQEMELKLKSFAPPYAFHPELYLLPGVENIYSSSSATPEKHSNNPEFVLTYASNQRPHSIISPDSDNDQTPTKLESSFKNNLSHTQEKYHFSEWNEKESVPILHKKQSSEQEKNGNIPEKGNLQRRKGKISYNTDKRESVPSLSSAVQYSAKNSASVKMHQKKPVSSAQEKHKTLRKDEKCKKTVASPQINQNHEEEENSQVQLDHIPQNTKEEIPVMLDTDTENGGNLTAFRMGRHTTADSGIPESLEDRDVEYLSSKRSQQHPGITKSLAGPGKLQNNQSDGSNLDDTANPSQCFPPPPPPPLLGLSVNTAQLPCNVFPKEESELNKQLQRVKAERKHLEKTREELIKKVKGLIEQKKLRKFHVRDSWKKKYFEMKKVTISLEEVVNRLQENLELHHQKLLRQLEARDIKKKQNNLTQNSNSKNNIIIQITTLQSEIDQLKRKLDNAKMKLVIEIKLKKQATSDLQALKAELAHKKVQSSLKFQSGKLPWLSSPK